MSYLLDKKNKRKKILNAAAILFFVALLFYFKAPIFRALSLVGHTVFRPALVLKNNAGTALGNWSAAFKSKSSLREENENLKMKLRELDALLLGYDSILDENNKLKEILGRKDEKSALILSAILGKPGQSLYDTLVINTGIDDGVMEGDLVFALGNVPVGRVAMAYPNSSKVVLFSSSGEKTEVALSDRGIFMQIVGRGGGNFEMILPRDFSIEKGSAVTLPGIFPYTIAIVKAIISDPRDSFAKALLTSPVNIQELKFVQVLR